MKVLVLIIPLTFAVTVGTYYLAQWHNRRISGVGAATSVDPFEDLPRHYQDRLLAARDMARLLERIQNDDMAMPVLPTPVQKEIGRLVQNYYEKR